MRGGALQREGRLGEALTDYEAAARIDEGRWEALNNAAWLIATTQTSRIADAKAYIDRALAMRPEEPSLLDTAAEVALVRGEGAEALRLIDQALAKAPVAKVPPYTVHKGRILEHQGMDDEARLLMEKLCADHPGDPAAADAKQVIWKIERKHMPPPEEEKEPTVPEEPEGAEDGKEDGAGE
jgi:tetratricopeptide (TPR) repeat protein